MSTTTPGPAPESQRPGTGFACAALAVAVAGLAGSLVLTWQLHLKACPLCFYQRTFMMALVAVLGMGLLARAGQAGRLGLLALPLAIGGLGVACFHVWLESIGKLECPQGLFGLGTAPKQSLGVFALLTALLIGEVLAGLGFTAYSLGSALAGVVLGLLLAAASCTSNPPMPPAPKAPYTSPLDVCRPPFVQAGP